jgi:YHS domain-containing protein
MNTRLNPRLPASSSGWHRRQWLTVMAVAALIVTLPLAAEAAGPVNLNNQGVALQGHDPVAYFVAGRPVKGAPEFSAKSNGALYWFSSAANLQAFQADPERYEPQYGGYCAYGVAQGAKPDIDPNAFAIVDGKLYLNLSPGVQKRWQADIPGHITQATKNWMTLKDQ